MYTLSGWFVSRVRDAGQCAIASPRPLSTDPTWWATTLASFFSTGKAKNWVVISWYGSFVLGRKLYCGNLSYNVSSSDLEELFTPFGTVQSAQVIEDRGSGRSKGFGFVEMGSDAEAQAAIEGLNEKEHDGRVLTVNEARPREERRGGGHGGGYGGKKGHDRGGGRY